MDNFSIRLITKEDYNKNHLELYKQLTIIYPEEISKEQYNNFIDNLNENHQIFVICLDDKIIATITVLIEKKLIRQLGKVGHIEDFVVDKKYTGKGLGRKMLNYVVNYCKEKGCYKVILNCDDHNKNFYEKCGFIKKENEMVLYF